MLRKDEASYSVDRREEPDKFYALCDENRRNHEQRIEETRAVLIEAGVPEKYIFVIQANRGENGTPEAGDLFAYSNKARLAEALGSIKECAYVCCSPDVFDFLCTDVRDTIFMSRYLYPWYFSEDWFIGMVAAITGEATNEEISQQWTRITQAINKRSGDSVAFIDPCGIYDENKVRLASSGYRIVSDQLIYTGTVVY